MISPSEQIERAIKAAEALGQSPGRILHAVMAELGCDFGEAEQVEADVMQYYADPANNPFVRAQQEARTLLDTDQMERLADAVKRADSDGLAAFEQTLRSTVAALDDHGEIDRLICRLVVCGIHTGVRRLNVNGFNAALENEIDRLNSSLNKHIG